MEMQVSSYLICSTIVVAGLWAILAIRYITHLISNRNETEEGDQHDQ